MLGSTCQMNLTRGKGKRLHISREVDAQESKLKRSVALTVSRAGMTRQGGQRSWGAGVVGPMTFEVSSTKDTLDQMEGSATTSDSAPSVR